MDLNKLSRDDLLELARMGVELAAAVESEVQPIVGIKPEYSRALARLFNKSRALREKAGE